MPRVRITDIMLMPCGVEKGGSRVAGVEGVNLREHNPATRHLESCCNEKDDVLRVFSSPANSFL